MKNNNFFFFFLFFPLLIQAQDQLQVFFDFNLNELNDASKKHLNDWIKENKEAEVLKIYGYSDEIGSIEYNDKLSLKRAQTVYKNLKNSAVKCIDKVEIKAFGKLFDLSENQDENRKVIIYFKMPKKSTVQPSGNHFVEEVKKVEVKEEKIKKEEVAKIASYEIPLATKIKSTKVGDKVKLEKLNFYLDSFIILPESEEILFELLDVMKKNKKMKIEVQGHNCCLPFDLNNISAKRAEAVCNFLKSNGIEKKRISYKGFGTTKPIFPVPEKNEEERIANRRVDIHILNN